MIDITNKEEKIFRQMSEEEQAALKAHHENGEAVECMMVGGRYFLTKTPRWHANGVYRAVLAPKLRPWEPMEAMGKVVRMKGKTTTCLTCAALLAALLFSGAARANSLGQVELQYSDCTPRQAAWTYLDGQQSGPFYTGTYRLELNPDVHVGAEADALVASAAVDGYIIRSYCADLMEYAPGSYELYDIYLPQDAPIGGGNTPMAPDRPADLRRLFDRHLGKVTDDNTAAAFQACVWEIIYEDAATYDVNYLSDKKGSFIFRKPMRANI